MRHKTNKMTDIEERTARLLHRFSIPHTFHHTIRYTAGHITVDFLIGDTVLECDGARWHQDKEREIKRDAIIQQAGFKVIHIPGTLLKDMHTAQASLTTAGILPY